jgi:hypothetical protein
MLSRRTFLGVFAAPAFALRSAPAAPRPLPPVSWTCTMHAEVVDDHPGKCPICSMTLVPVRLDLVWSCQLHPDITSMKPGRCPICGRDFVHIIKAVSFSCPVHRKYESIDPGKCPTCGRTLKIKYSVRPHGDHNPKHGGFFFMASNNWHVEVTHPAVSLFRLYVYDNYSKPFTPKGLQARVIEVPGADGKPANVSIPFKPEPGRGYLDLRIPDLALPATIAVKVRFQPNDQEYRFDFPFLDYSKEPRGRR